MIIPSIDLMNGHAVQLVEGKTKVLDAGDPRPLAMSFGMVGEVAVIDLDAALGQGDNGDVIRELLKLAPCRVGGGIRDVETAIAWLDAGARKVILGTAAIADVLRELPRERVIAALDARHNDVVVEGWTRATGMTIEQRIDELREYVSGFLVTFVEREGRMGGLPHDRIAALVQRAAPARLTVAGGVRAADEIARVDGLGADAQVGMALYTNAFDLAEGFCAPLQTDRPDGLWPTIVSDVRGGVLGLVYSNLDSVRAALRVKRGVYYSRSRKSLWTKGETSGDIQDLVRIDVDCDRDALRFIVKQHGNGFCHTGSQTCFGDVDGLAALEQTIIARLENAPTGSYTRRLLDDAELLRSKLLEEVVELLDAHTSADAAHEAADVLYFALVAAAKRGATLTDIQQELDTRALRISRRAGNAKPAGPEASS
ncbi:MAG: phosphoribosyl-ATP diphosphatase [Phycisphaerales bacterium]